MKNVTTTANSQENSLKSPDRNDESKLEDAK